MIARMLDVAAGKWLDWRAAQLMKKDRANMEEVTVLKAEFNQKGYKAMMEHPGVAFFAEEIASFMDKVDAENYYEFEFWPRADRRIGRIRATFIRARGMSPGNKVERLSAIIEECAVCQPKAEEQRLIWHPKEEGDDEG